MSSGTQLENSVTQLSLCKINENINGYNIFLFKSLEKSSSQFTIGYVTCLLYWLYYSGPHVLPCQLTLFPHTPAYGEWQIFLLVLSICGKDLDSFFIITKHYFFFFFFTKDTFFWPWTTIHITFNVVAHMMNQLLINYLSYYFLTSIPTKMLNQ